MNLIALVIVIFAIVEIGLFVVVRLSRRAFPWLISGQDEIPKLDARALQKFLDDSFDSRLGWVRKPDSSGIERGQKGDIKFHIDSSGSRSNRFAKLSPSLAAFGDSYVFCRQVEDDETWEAQLSDQNEMGVLNYGVGNYGADQALLRYEGMTLPSSVQVVVIGFVPETICRIQSCWKHYLEFGNTFAFKPRFVLDPEGKLSLLENPMQSADDFSCFQDMLSKIQAGDRFYKKKFRTLQFRFPYIVSLLRNPARQIKLVCAIAFRGLLRAIGKSTVWSESLPFALVMKDNIRASHRMYSDNESTELMGAILSRFKEVAMSRGHIPLVLVMPQLLDLKLAKYAKSPYQDFFRNMNTLLPVLDLTDKFLNREIEKLYINDQFGGHFSPAGNYLVAEAVSNWLASSNLNS
jgi:hypothetical protein